MPYVDHAFVKYREYLAGEESRLKEPDFVVNAVYTAMFALKKNFIRKEAVKYPVRLISMVQPDAGLYTATLSLLDQDLRDEVTVEAEFNQGFWLNVGQVCYFEDSRKNAYPTRSSYLASYSDGFGLDDRAVIALSESTSVLNERALVL